MIYVSQEGNSILQQLTVDLYYIQVLLTVIVYMSTLTYWSFLFLYFFVRLLCGANRLYVRLSLLSHEFEQFRSLHMCAPRKHIGRSGTRTRYPQAPRQPRYQWAILTPRHIYTSKWTKSLLKVISVTLYSWVRTNTSEDCSITLSGLTLQALAMH